MKPKYSFDWDNEISMFYRLQNGDYPSNTLENLSWKTKTISLSIRYMSQYRFRVLSSCPTVFPKSGKPPRTVAVGTSN
jgi:hypothetical protein